MPTPSRDQRGWATIVGVYPISRWRCAVASLVRLIWSHRARRCAPDRGLARRGWCCPRLRCDTRRHRWDLRPPGPDQRSCGVGCCQADGRTPCSPVVSRAVLPRGMSGTPHPRALHPRYICGGQPYPDGTLAYVIQWSSPCWRTQPSPALATRNEKDNTE